MNSNNSRDQMGGKSIPPAPTNNSSRITSHHTQNPQQHNYPPLAPSYHIQQTLNTQNPQQHCHYPNHLNYNPLYPPTFNPLFSHRLPYPPNMVYSQLPPYMVERYPDTGPPPNTKPPPNTRHLDEPNTAPPPPTFCSQNMTPSSFSSKISNGQKEKISKEDMKNLTTLSSYQPKKDTPWTGTCVFCHNTFQGKVTMRRHLETCPALISYAVQVLIIKAEDIGTCVFCDEPMRVGHIETCPTFQSKVTMRRHFETYSDLISYAIQVLTMKVKNIGTCVFCDEPRRVGHIETCPTLYSYAMQVVKANAKTVNTSKKTNNTTQTRKRKRDHPANITKKDSPHKTTNQDDNVPFIPFYTHFLELRKEKQQWEKQQQLLLLLLQKKLEKQEKQEKQEQQPDSEDEDDIINTLLSYMD